VINVKTSFRDWKQRTRSLKRDVRALFFAKRDPRMPWYAKLLGGVILAYALSPIDLIPDFIPVLGYLDDLILLPAGILLLLQLIPAEGWKNIEQKLKIQNSGSLGIGYLGCLLLCFGSWPSGSASTLCVTGFSGPLDSVNLE